ncbi:MAG: DUF2142 domain-containing protein [Geitlerinemataceae cyanobacterium]
MAQASRSSAQFVQRAFVAIAAIVCLAMAIVTPPFQAADEYLHFYRAYQISEGQLVPTRQTGACSGYERDFEETLCLGGALPRSLLATVRGASAEDLRFDRDRKQDLESLRQLWSLALAPGDRQFLKFNTTGLHAPLGYLPQAIGIGLGRTLSADRLPPVALMYLGRIANAIVWIAAVSFAIAVAPEAVLVWLAIGLLPMALFQAASLSADVLTNGLACAIVATVWRYRSRPFGSAIVPEILSIVAALFAVTKLAYAPMALVLCLVPPRAFVSTAKRSRAIGRWRWLGTTALITIALVAVWSRIVDRIYVPLHPDLDPNAQIAGILGNPVGFFGTAIATLVGDAGTYLHQFVGVFGWLDTPLPKLHVALYAVFFLGVLLCKPPRDLRSSPRPLLTDRAIAGVGLLGSVGLLCVLAYLWNVVGADRIGGIQGRYFIPLAPLLLPTFWGLVSLPAPKNIERWAIAAAAISGLAAIATLIERYYAI